MQAADDTHEAAKAFRKGSRAQQHLVLAVIANVGLAAAFLGVPYVRGRAQATTSLHEFTRFAGCLLGAEPQPNGLGFPHGEREHFAALVLRGASDWPARCRPALQRIAPEEAIFLWPSIKVANGDVRATVKLVDQELSTLARARARGQAGRVPERPLLAVARLRAALALLAKAADADDGIDENAIAFKKSAAVTDPARLPIVAGSNAALEVWAGQDGLSALALDGRGVSWLRVEGGKIAHRRWKRTSQMRAALRDAGAPLLVWATARTRCEQEEGHCVRRASGVARLDPDAEQLPMPQWLSGHLDLRADRGLRLLYDERVDLIVRSDTQGTLEVRRFKLEPQVRDDAPPSAALERFALPSNGPPKDALLLHSQPAALVYAAAAADGAGIQASLLRYDSAEPPIALGTLAGAGAFIAACDAEGARFIAVGTAEQLSIFRAPDSGAPTTLLDAAQIALGDPIHPEDRNRDRLRLLCTGDSARIVATTAARKLITLGCDAARCSQGPELASDVSAFDATLAGADTLVSYARATQPELVVQRVDAGGQVLAPAVVPAACWDPTSGMCGQPTLVADAGRLLLCARDGSDLLALESEDQGQSWKPLSGLKVSGAIDTEADTAMRQHRKRKGLD